MALDCNCPLGTALTTIDATDCAFSYGKIGKIIFQRLDDTTNIFVDGTNGIELETSWSALPDAVDDTKVVITPLTENVVFGDPAILEDSENLDGAPIVVGNGPQVVTFEMRNVVAEQFLAMKDLACETNVVAYFLDNNGNFLARNTGDATTTYAGIKLSPTTLVFRDPQRGGTRVDQFKVMAQFALPAGWFTTAETIAPETGFDPLTEIVPS